MDDLKKNFNKIYPLFFTIVFILVILQYSFSSLESIFYDLRIRFDFSVESNKDIVLIVQDEESDEFLGENFPYSYATHLRFIERLLESSPLLVNYFIPLSDVESKSENEDMLKFKKLVLAYTKKGGFFRFGTDMDDWGEQLPPKELRPLGYSLALNNVDNSTFSRDDVCRRAILDISGDESLHLWTANKFREHNQREKLISSKLHGSYYVREAEANFALFKYSENPNREATNIIKVPYHKVLVGSFPKGFFKDKIVLIGPEYISNFSNFIFTPFNKEELKASRLNVHAQIINALINNDTIRMIPKIISDILAIVIGIFLSLVISRLQPAKGLYITIGTLFGVFISSYLLFCLGGLWLYQTHLILTVFIVYYIWVPFRAIDEYQTRYKIEEESKILKKVDHLKQNFISLMSHDLKTPVAKIAGIADILKNQYTNSDGQRDHLSRISDATRELNKFITSILDLTKVESRNFDLVIASKDVNKIIESAIDDLRYEAETKDIELSLDLAPLYPVKLDVVLMKRVFSNLVENSIKYSQKGTMVRIKSYDNDEFVFIEIADSGPGIKPEDLEHVFEKFYRVKNDASHKIKGSGLGLYLVKYFVELQGGTISVNSETGKGTTFIIKLKNE